MAYGTSYGSDQVTYIQAVIREVAGNSCFISWGTLFKTELDHLELYNVYVTAEPFLVKC